MFKNCFLLTFISLPSPKSG